MTTLSYGDKLKNPLWQKKRLDILNRDQFTCQLCSDTTTELHIHHKEYIKGREPWEYEDSNFQTLCKHCHEVSEYLKGDTIILVSKFHNDLINNLTVDCIIVSKIYGLAISVFMHDGSKLNHIITLRRSTLSEFENLFKHCEKLLIDGKRSSFPILPK